MRKPMTVSPAKMEANRRNAQKSTGPKTVSGKGVSKMNALKHGVLARSVVVQGHKFRESPREFKRLCQDFYAELAPIGPLEETLVDQIIQATWRLRRARTAESGEIALGVDAGWWKRENSHSLLATLNMPQTPFNDPLVTELERSMEGCHYLIYCLQQVSGGVERDGELTETALQDFRGGLCDKPNPMTKKLEQLRAWFAANPEKLGPGALRARHKADVLKYLEQQIRDIGFTMDRREEREEAEERARQTAAMLPSSETLEKILRYETALERQLFRAINQLERLQRRRQGEHITAPVTMEIATRL